MTEPFVWRKKDLIRSIYAGQTVTYRMQIKDQDNEPLDLTLFGVSFGVFRDFFPRITTPGGGDDGKPVISKRSESLGGFPGEIVVTDYERGEIEIHIKAEETQNLMPCTHYYMVTAEGIAPSLINTSSVELQRYPIVNGALFIIDDKKYYYAISLLRDFMQDYDIVNRIIETETGEEFTDKQLHTAIDMAIDSFNSVNPPLDQRYGLTNFPSKELLMKGALYYTLFQSGILKTRNLLSYATQGGVSVNDNSQGPYYMQWINLLAQEWNIKAGSIRRALNASLCYTSFSSEYLGIDWRGTVQVDGSLIEVIYY